MQIQITGIKELQEKLDALASKKLGMVTAAAIRDTAFQVRSALQSEMRTVFDRPTPWATNTVRIDLTEANRNQQSASIGLDYEGGKSASMWETPSFAQHQVFGGGRSIKASERQLRAAGILPPGMSIAPARDAWLDPYGNIPGPEMVQILSSVKAFGETGYLMNKTGTSRGKKKNRYFVMKRAGRAIGIWENRGPGNVAPVIMFIKQPAYKSRFNFFIVAQNVIFKNWRKNFKARLDEYTKYIIK